MKAAVFTVLTLILVFVLYFKRRSVALWTADPFQECSVESFKTGEGDFFVEYLVYENKNKSLKSSMLVLPPTGGKNIIDEGYAAGLCRSGFKVYVLEDWENIKEYELDYSIHQTYQNKTQRAFNKMIEIMDGDKVGVLGTSAGGINFAVSLGNETVAKKVGAFFTIVSGVPLCKVIANSEEKGLRGIREKRFEETEVTNMKEYEKNVCDAVSWEAPESLSKGIAYGAIISKNDVTVSTRFQLEMVENYKPTVLIKSEKGHFFTVVASYFLHRRSVVDFFKKALK